MKKYLFSFLLTSFTLLYGISGNSPGVFLDALDEYLTMEDPDRWPQPPPDRSNISIGLEADFGQGELPEGWQSAELGDPEHGWQFLADFIWINSIHNEDFHVAGELVSPPIDCSDMDLVLLGINMWYVHYHSPPDMVDAEIRYSTDGNTWETFYVFTGSVGGASDPYIEWDITDIASGEENLQLKFWFDDQEELRGLWRISELIVYSPVEPIFSIEPQLDTWDFGTVVMGQSSEPKTFTVTNIGSDLLVVQKPGLDNNADFSVLHEDDAFPAALGFNESVSFEVVYHPLSPGEHNASLEMIYNDSGNEVYQMDFTGDGLDPTITEFPWTEIFPHFDFPPTGWFVVNGVENAHWHRTNVHSHTGSRSARAFYGPQSGYKADEWLISPPLVLDHPEAELLYFYLRSTWTSDDWIVDDQIERLEIWLLDQVSYDVDLLPGMGEMISEAYSIQDWRRHSIDLRSYSGTKHIAFRYVIDETGGWNHMYLDNVNIETVVNQNLTMLEPAGEEGFVTPQAGEHDYFFGEEAYLYADADYTWAWKFDKWEVDGAFYSNQPDTLLVMEDDHVVQGFFVPDLLHNLDMHAPDGEGSTKPEPGTHSFASGTTLSIEAVPEHGWTFSHWISKGSVFSNNPQEVVNITSYNDFQAVFVPATYFEVSFQVSDSEGNPVQDAEVTLNGQTNAPGDYVFPSVFPGEYAYSVSALDYLVTGGELTVTDGSLGVEVMLQELPLDVHRVVFSILDESGQPLDDAVVILNGYANAAGDYVFAQIPDGSYPYAVVRTGYLRAEGVIEVSGQDVTEHALLLADQRLFFEDFTANVQPGGWQVFVHGDPDFAWTFQEEKAYISPSQENHVLASLVSPPIDISQAQAFTLGMKHYYNPYGETSAEIRASADGLTWTTIQAFGGNSEGDLNLPYLEYPVSGHVDFHEQIYLAFFFDSYDSFNSWFNWSIDEVVLFEPVPHQFAAQRISPNLYLEPSSTGTYEMSVFNSGALDDVYSIEQITGQWDYSYPASIAVSQGTEEELEIEVDVPANLSMGVRDTLQLRFVSQGDPEISHLVEFITVSKAPISEPYYEDFDVVTAPAIPGGWSKREGTDQQWARVQTIVDPSFAPVSSPNNIRINNSTDLDAEMILISPPIADDMHLSEFRTRLWLRNGNTSLLVGTMPDPEGEFNPIAEVSALNHFTWKQVMVSFEHYEGNDRYIAFKQNVTQSSTAVSIDDIHIEPLMSPIFAINKEGHDFGENWEDVESPPITFQIYNPGHYELVIGDISLDNGEHFQIQNVSASLPADLQWGDTLYVDVVFHPLAAGHKQDAMLIDYFDGQAQVYSASLEGTGMVRPPGSTCENPIFVDLPIVDYAGSTEDYHRDYFYNYITPANWWFNGNDKVFAFTLHELSFLSGSITGSWASVFILADCPSLENPAQVLTGALAGTQFESFEDVVLNPGNYFAIVSSNHSNPPLHTEFVLNLSANPLPDFYDVTFQVVEASEQQTPLEGVRIYVEGQYMSGNVYTDENGFAFAELLEGDYTAEVFKQDYELQNISFGMYEDQSILIELTDLIWTPSDLQVQTEGLPEGHALLSWNKKPAGEPWTEAFQDDFPPDGWSQIINNDGGLDPDDDGADWLFTWQQYGTIYFDDATVEPMVGDYQAFVHWSQFPQDEWLITHSFVAPADDLVFWYFGRNGLSGQDFFLKISVDDGDSWTPLWNASDLPFAANHYEYPAIVDLTYYGGQTVKLAWNAVGPNGLLSAFMLDDITVGDMRIDVSELQYVSKNPHPAKGNPELSLVASHRMPGDAPRIDFEEMARERSRVFSNFEVFLNDLDNPYATGVEDTSFLFVDLPAGNHTAGVRAVYTTGISELATTGFDIEGEVDVSLSFIVKDAHGQEIPHAVITFNGQTHEPGQYHFTNLTPGSYDYLVEAECHLASSGVLELAGGHHQYEVVLGHTPGDANGDGMINVLDAIMILAYFQGDNPQPFCFINADVNHDGEVNVLDAISTLNIYMEGKAQPFRGLRSEKAYLRVSDEGVSLLSDGSITGIQFSLGGEHLYEREVELLLPTHTMAKRQTDGEWQFMIISLTNAPIPAGNTPLLRLSGHHGRLAVSDVLAGNLNAQPVDVAVESSETTGFADHWDAMGLKVYPNPASDRLGVEFMHPGGSVANVHLLHIDGRLLQWKRIEEKGFVRLHFDLSSYDAGIYLLRLDHEGHSLVERIVLK